MELFQRDRQYGDCDTGVGDPSRGEILNDPRAHRTYPVVEHVWNVMAHAQKPDLVFQRNGWVHLNGWGSQFSRLLAVEECGSAGRPWIDHVPRYSARVVATLPNRLFPLHFPSQASPCAITIRAASEPFPEWKSGRDVNMTTHFRLVPTSRIRGALPPLPPCCQCAVLY